MVEGSSEKVYLERLHRLNPNVSMKVKVTNKKKAVDIVAECVKLSSREGLMPSDVRAVLFDCDTISKEDMEEAITMAKKKNVLVLVSNLCFEYWLLLHFEEPSMRLDTEDLYEKELSKLLGRKYIKAEGLKSLITKETATDAITRSHKRLPSGDPMECYSKLNSTCMHTIAELILEEK